MFRCNAGSQLNRPALREGARWSCGGCGRNPRRYRPARVAPEVLRGSRHCRNAPAISSALAEAALAAQLYTVLAQLARAVIEFKNVEPKDWGGCGGRRHLDFQKRQQDYHSSPPL